MDAKLFLEEWRRMCNSLNCDECPLALTPVSGCLGRYLDDDTDICATEIAETVEEWAKENPRKTLLQDFLEKYPDTPVNSQGAPTDICPMDIGYPDDEDCGNASVVTCLECWSRTLEELEEV